MKGKTSIEFFFSLKLHMIFNAKGQLVPLSITSGDIDD